MSTARDQPPHHLTGEAATSVEIVLTGAGGPEMLQAHTARMPRAGATQVVIATEAAGVAFNDITTRLGLNPGRLPRVLGFDVVGTVTARGESVHDIAVGRRVGALVGTGGYATHVVADRRVLVPLPDDVDAAEVDALLLNYTVAHQMLHDVAHVEPGQHVLVHGAAGGVGSALLQLARVHGVAVTGISSPARRVWVETAGAAWAPSAVAARGPFDAVFDGVGGPSLAASRSVTRRGGTVVSYGFSFAVTAGHSRLSTLVRTLAALLRARLTAGPSVQLFLVERVLAEHPERLAETMGRLIPLLRERSVVPAVHRVPLDQAAHAHELLQSRTVHGKVVLIPGMQE